MIKMPWSIFRFYFFDNLKSFFQNKLIWSFLIQCVCCEMEMDGCLLSKHFVVFFFTMGVLSFFLVISSGTIFFVLLWKKWSPMKCQTSPIAICMNWATYFEFNWPVLVFVWNYRGFNVPMDYNCCNITHFLY